MKKIPMDCMNKKIVYSRVHEGKRKKFKNVTIKWMKRKLNQEKEREFLLLIQIHIYTTDNKRTFNRLSSCRIFFFIFTIYMIIETHYDKYQLNYFLLLFNFMLFTKSKGTVHQRKLKGKKCRMLMEVIYIIME